VLELQAASGGVHRLSRKPISWQTSHILRVAQVRTAHHCEEPVLEAVAGRHPVIEQWMEETREGRFIANDLYLNAADWMEMAADQACCL